MEVSSPQKFESEPNSLAQRTLMHSLEGARGVESELV